jgi:hypothetical protein
MVMEKMTKTTTIEIRITKEYWHMSKNDDQWLRRRIMTEVKIDAERLWDWLSMIENMPINLGFDDGWNGYRCRREGCPMRKRMFINMIIVVLENDDLWTREVCDE